VDPSWDIGLTQLAQMLLQNGKFDEAMEKFDMAISLARTDPELRMAISFKEVILFFMKGVFCSSCSG
jgi:import receptor subunit TOM70